MLFLKKVVSNHNNHYKENSSKPFMENSELILHPQGDFVKYSNFKHLYKAIRKNVLTSEPISQSSIPDLRVGSTSTGYTAGHYGWETFLQEGEIVTLEYTDNWDPFYNNSIRPPKSNKADIRWMKITFSDKTLESRSKIEKIVTDFGCADLLIKPSKKKE